jgi:site-specific recombinase XerD
MPAAPPPRNPDPAAVAALEADGGGAAAGWPGDAPVGSARTWRVACARCGRRGYRLLEHHPHGWLPASARRCACGSRRFQPLAERRRRQPADHRPADRPTAAAADGGGTSLAPAASFAEHLDGARTWAGNALAPATRDAYARAWRHFRAWCAGHGRAPLPADPATVAAYLDAHTRPRRYQTSTIQLRLAAISHVHRLAGLPDPAADEQVRLVWKGIRRDRHAPAVAPAEPATGPQLTKALGKFGRPRPRRADGRAGGNADRHPAGDPAALPAARPDAGGADPDGGEVPLADVRDRALLAIGLFAGRRSAELVGLNLEDVRETDDGLRVRFRFSKTNQEGKPDWLGLPYMPDEAACPVRAWRAWSQRLAGALLERGETAAPTDPAFRPVDRWGHLGPGRLTTRGVRDVFARRFAAAGLTDNFSPHSLRRGFATAARQGGADLVAIMRHGGWKSAQTVSGYIEEADLFRDNPAAKIRL